MAILAVGRRCWLLSVALPQSYGEDAIFRLVELIHFTKEAMALRGGGYPQMITVDNGSKFASKAPDET